MPGIARVVRLAGRAACLVVLVSFGVFAAHHTTSATNHAIGEISGKAAPVEHGQSSVHRLIDEASGGLTSPFDELTGGISSEWTVRIVDVLLALVLYGVILGYVARLISLRV
jgi:hypothetical protein